MEAICTKNVVVNGILVFTEGEIYHFNEVLNDGVETIEVKSNYGYGVWSKNDKHLKNHFKKEGEFGFKRYKKKIQKNR